ncbi:hypothetical protein [Actinomadura verrucosospora]|uniref:hypothetical protein n=1 Tax=Actinomadura verrucosospora TaxID=46165 RepID=UPI0031E97D19
MIAPGGLLDRLHAATSNAAIAPHGLEQAWGLVAATLTVEAETLARLWPDGPEHDLTPMTRTSPAQE